MVRAPLAIPAEPRLRSTAITPERLEAFCAVAETGSFRAAAERLFVSQPAVSMHIRLLETYCQTSLLVRSPRGAVLTPAGQLLYDQARAILEQLHQLERTAQRLRRLDARTLHLGISRGLTSPRLIRQLAALRREHPQLAIEVRWDTSLHLAQQVAAGQLDAALVAREFLSRHNLTGLLTVPCGIDQLVAVAAPSLLANRHASSNECIARGPYVRLGGSCGLQHYVEASIPAVATAETAIVLDDANQVRTAVLEGMGIAFFAKSAVEAELAQGQLHLIAPAVASLRIQRVLLTASRTHEPTMQLLAHYFAHPA